MGSGIWPVVGEEARAGAGAVEAIVARLLAERPGGAAHARHVVDGGGVVDEGLALPGVIGVHVRLLQRQQPQRLRGVGRGEGGPMRSAAGL